MRRATRLLGRLMIVTGLLALLIIGGRWWLGNASAERAQARTARHLQHEFASGNVRPVPHAQQIVHQGSQSREPPVESSSESSVPQGAFALIRIPRFGTDYVRPIVQGTGAAELKEGVGHYRGTAGPGALGNFAVAGHRTTYGEPFHLIADLRVGDQIIVRTRARTYTYQVVSHEVVDPSDLQVIAPEPPGVRPGHLMTLTSCHPMYLALQRYVVHAQLVSMS